MPPFNQVPYLRQLLRRIAATSGLLVSAALGLTILSHNSLTLNWFNRITNIGNINIQNEAPTEPNSPGSPPNDAPVFEPIITITLPQVVFTPAISVDTSNSFSIELGDSGPAPLPPSMIEVKTEITIDNTDNINLGPQSSQPQINEPFNISILPQMPDSRAQTPPAARPALTFPGTADTPASASTSTSPARLQLPSAEAAIEVAATPLPECLGGCLLLPQDSEPDLQDSRQGLSQQEPPSPNEPSLTAQSGRFRVESSPEGGLAGVIIASRQTASPDSLAVQVPNGSSVGGLGVLGLWFLGQLQQRAASQNTES